MRGMMNWQDDELVCHDKYESAGFFAILFAILFAMIKRTTVKFTA